MMQEQNADKDKKCENTLVSSSITVLVDAAVGKSSSKNKFEFFF